MAPLKVVVIDERVLLVQQWLHILLLPLLLLPLLLLMMMLEVSDQRIGS